MKLIIGAIGAVYSNKEIKVFAINIDGKKDENVVKKFIEKLIQLKNLDLMELSKEVRKVVYDQVTADCLNMFANIGYNVPVMISNIGVVTMDIVDTTDL